MIALRKNLPALSFVASLCAVAGTVLLVYSLRALPEATSARLFIYLFPAVILFAIAGFLLATVKPPQGYTIASLAAFLFGGGILLGILAFFFLPLLSGIAGG